MNRSKYKNVRHPINSKLYVVQNQHCKWGVVDENDNVIVPFDKYRWIDGFHNGLAKVMGHNDTTKGPNVEFSFSAHDFDPSIPEPKRIAAQGIINEKGEEVLPLEYTIWKFYGKGFPTIKAFKGDAEYKFSFEQLKNCIEDDDVTNDNYDDYPDHDQLKRDTWYAMTDGQYGDMPEGHDGDYSFLGY